MAEFAVLLKLLKSSLNNFKIPVDPFTPLDRVCNQYPMPCIDPFKLKLVPDPL